MKHLTQLNIELMYRRVVCKYPPFKSQDNKDIFTDVVRILTNEYRYCEANALEVGYAD